MKYYMQTDRETANYTVVYTTLEAAVKSCEEDAEEFNDNQEEDYRIYEFESDLIYSEACGLTYNKIWHSITREFDGEGREIDNKEEGNF